VSGCNNHYKFILNAGAEAKSVTTASAEALAKAELPLPASPELANCTETRLMYTLCCAVVHYFIQYIF